MLDQTTAILICLLVGALGGFTNSLMRWLEGTESFETKKNIKGILTGVFTGLALGVATVSTITADITTQALIVALALVFLAAVGVDTATSRISGMVSKQKPTEP